MKKHFKERDILVININLSVWSNYMIFLKINQYQSILDSEIDLYSMLASNGDN